MDGWKTANIGKKKAAVRNEMLVPPGLADLRPLGEKNPTYLHRNLEANVTLLLRGKYSEAKENCDNI